MIKRICLVISCSFLLSIYFGEYIPYLLNYLSWEYYFDLIDSFDPIIRYCDGISYYCVEFYKFVQFIIVFLLSILSTLMLVAFVLFFGKLMDYLFDE